MTASTIPTPRIPGAVALAAALWVVLAAAAGVSGFLVRLPFPGPQIIILALFAGTLIAGFGVSRLRTWIEGLPLGALVGLHAVRFVGVVFLLYAAAGQLSPVFATPAGWGDVAVASLAVVLVATGGALTPRRRLVYHVWNALGFVDLVVAVTTATVVTMGRATPGVDQLLGFPLAIVPAFFVPILLASHVFIYRRLVSSGR